MRLLKNNILFDFVLNSLRNDETDYKLLRLRKLLETI